MSKDTSYAFGKRCQEAQEPKLRLAGRETNFALRVGFKLTGDFEVAPQNVHGTAAASSHVSLE
jgi:hypothetical protein